MNVSGRRHLVAELKGWVFREKGKNESSLYYGHGQINTN